MLNLFQHLTGLVFCLIFGKIPNRVRDDILTFSVTARKSLIFAAVQFYSIVKFVLDCFVAFAPRNDMKLVVPLTNPIHLPPLHSSQIITHPNLVLDYSGCRKVPSFPTPYGLACGNEFLQNSRSRTLHPTENPLPQKGRRHQNCFKSPFTIHAYHLFTPHPYPLSRKGRGERTDQLNPFTLLVTQSLNHLVTNKIHLPPLTSIHYSLAQSIYPRNDT